MPRTDYGAQIKRRVIYLTGQGVSIQMDQHAAGYRAFTADGKRSLSGRLPARYMVDWLDAFETGYDIGIEAGVKAMRKGEVVP